MAKTRKRITHTRTADGFQNFLARVGAGANPMLTASRYGRDMLTFRRDQLDNMYETSWICGQIVDVIAEDMTRAGIQIGSGLPPEDIQRLDAALVEMRIFPALCDTIKWARLYGGALAVILIDGEDMATPLQVESIGPGRFKGLLPLDRWQVEPSLTDLEEEYGPDYGMPLWYRITGYGASHIPGALNGTRIHHSRIVRFEGISLPHQRRGQENSWGISVLSRLYDQLVAYDSATLGAAQLIYKAHLRVYAVDKLREVVASGGKAYEGLLRQMECIRAFQSNEGLTLIDKEDGFQTYSYSFGGLSDVMAEFGQQLAGATGIPLVRLFGQSPRGFSTGDTDLRNYYDTIRSRQETQLRTLVQTLLRIMSMSVLSKPLPEEFGFAFTSLWQLTDEQKAAIAAQDTSAVIGLVQSDVFSRKQALEELRQTGTATGRYSNITDQDIAEAGVEGQAGAPVFDPTVLSPNAEPDTEPDNGD